MSLGFTYSGGICAIVFDNSELSTAELSPTATSSISDEVSFLPK